jgi:hypothetical protein
VQGGRTGAAAITDMGAFEYSPHPPTVVASATPSTAPVGSLVIFSAAGSSDPDPGDTLKYAWRFDDGKSATGTSVSHRFLHGGSHSGTVTVTDGDGFSVAMTAAVTVRGGGPGRDSNLKVSPNALRPAASGPSAQPARAKPGAIVSYFDSLAETSRFAVQRPAAGVVRRHTCVKPPGNAKAGHKLKRCTRYVTVGGFSRSDHAGANRFRFTGRINGHALKRGNYRLRAQTELRGALGKSVYALFRVV